MYTFETFAYKLLNAVLRGTYDPFALSYVDFFMQDMLNAIKYFSQKQLGFYKEINY